MYLHTHKTILQHPNSRKNTRNSRPIRLTTRQTHISKHHHRLQTPSTLAKPRHHPIPRHQIWLNPQLHHPPKHHFSFLHTPISRIPGNQRATRNNIQFRHFIKHLVCIIQLPTFHIQMHQRRLHKRIQTKPR
ncbi:hypothetical protein HanRHA438_Chr14g0632701 [Helianthus annuus]|nr:hypothetical protein HanRHA438_Chr14g0632701 [Helianthus annuus]